MQMFEVRKDINQISGNYAGDYPNLAMSGMLKLKIDKDKLIFKQLWKTYHKLDLKNITDVQLKTEEEISKDVTLTRLLAFGIFAFALKKKRTNQRYFIIISTKEDGFDNDFVMEIDTAKGFGLPMAQGFVKTLRKEVIKYRD
ncbi:hypothetical protein [Clostridium botulinum]|uniref:hypothetical protein n=1 Tax=Clostridium botulinum TaxID=1491 RepID=UPI0006AC6F6E|nr:hypothetical protein [Clostridium botulinum]KOR52857.1 hypothetical protein ADT23_07450 [Clostridium botulinum]MBY6908889.1 hypothetical protein [Clostridium botulinum]MBY6923550.1 hypothetical protein [Clostridium botulinum]NFN91451.1 hypothetical protein [Clostridium botulinum]HBJ2601391.1 hypothetical protein [Clostridium botulinum]